MIIGSSRFAFFALVAAGCLAAFAIGRRPRPLDKRQLEESLRTWEDEGGNLARSGNPRLGRPAANP
jgi:hypothetical protein